MDTESTFKPFCPTGPFKRQLGSPDVQLDKGETIETEEPDWPLYKVKVLLLIGTGLELKNTSNEEENRASLGVLQGTVG